MPAPPYDATASRDGTAGIWAATPEGFPSPGLTAPGLLRSPARMRRVALLFALPFALLTTSGIALADVPNSPGKCKCSTPGLPVQGSMAGVMAGGGALLLFVSRRRRPK